MKHGWRSIVVSIHLWVGLSSFANIVASLAASTMVTVSSITLLHQQFKIHGLQSLVQSHLLQFRHGSLPFQGTVAPIRPLPYDDAAHAQICEDVPLAAEHAFASTHGPYARRKYEIRGSRRRVEPAYFNVFAAAVEEQAGRSELT